MTKKQLIQFKTQLLEWKSSIEKNMMIEAEIDIINSEIEEADENEGIEKKNIIDFQSKRNEYQIYILSEINHALKKIENDSFGFCEETGETIDIKRLKANPIARYSLETQLLIENNH